MSSDMNVKVLRVNSHGDFKKMLVCTGKTRIGWTGRIEVQKY